MGTSDEEEAKEKERSHGTIAICPSHAPKLDFCLSPPQVSSLTPHASRLTRRLACNDVLDPRDALD